MKIHFEQIKTNINFLEINSEFVVYGLGVGSDEQVICFRKMECQQQQ